MKKDNRKRDQFCVICKKITKDCKNQTVKNIPGTLDYICEVCAKKEGYLWK